jgi:plastocyanin
MTRRAGSAPRAAPVWVRVARVRGSRHVAATAVFGVALLVPVLPLGAQEPAADPAPSAAPPSLVPSNVAPQATLDAAVQGRTVTFDASRSTDSDGRIGAYAWDLDGDSVYETTTADRATVERRYPAGTALVASVRVTDDAGATADATATVAVDDRGDAAAAPERTLTPSSADPAVATAGDTPPAREPAREQLKAAEPAIRAAAAKGVTIRDFEFAPGTTTIAVGDTVTWTNAGPSIHTATAGDGSFDSGNLAEGKSYSKTFNSAGTFSYICTPHPFMTGRIVVSSAGSPGGSGGGGSSGSGDGSGSGSSGSGSGAGTDTTTGGLARTGADLVPWSLFGFAMLAFGAALRWRLNAD